MADFKIVVDLAAYDGDRLIAKQRFEQNKIVIGRILSADFKISNPRVSRIHALIEKVGENEFKITDLASSHGVFVNGARVLEQKIDKSSEIKIADIRLVMTPSAIAVEKPAPQSVSVKAERTAAPVSSPSIGAAPQAAHAAPMAAAPEVSVPAGDFEVNVPKEATVIRSLKSTAQDRGVLDRPMGVGESTEVTVYWLDSVLAVDHYAGTHTVTIGETEKCDYLVPSVGLPPMYDFLKISGASTEIAIHPSMKLSARIQGTMYTHEDFAKMGRSVISLAGPDLAKVQVGNVHFFIMAVPKAPPIAGGAIVAREPLFWTVFAGVIAFVILMLTLLSIFEAPIEGRVKEIPEKMRKIIVEAYKEKKIAPPPPVAPPPPPMEAPKPPPKTLPKKADKRVTDAKKVAEKAVSQKGGNEGEGARERGTEGKRGNPNAKHETGITNRPKIDPNRRNQVKDGPVKASSDSVLDSLKNSGLGSRIAAKGSPGGGASGNDPLDKAFQGVGGDSIRSGIGSGGSGLQGTGKGGGGTAVGVGGLGTKGFGGGATGDGVGSLPGKGEFAISTETTGVSVAGSLSRKEIERVINSHQNEIEFCYQQALARSPSMSGRIMVRATIVTGGKVSAASVGSNSTNDAAFGSCIVNALRGWTFPSPQGGSEASFEWPWLFKPSL
ncbi:MAG TPA: TonB family protein [Bdellovibrionota bacterium]|nr:TonB family protein [Bdellovibrionota bacterium]